MALLPLLQWRISPDETLSQPRKNSWRLIWVHSFLFYTNFKFSSLKKCSSDFLLNSFSFNFCFIATLFVFCRFLLYTSKVFYTIAGFLLIFTYIPSTTMIIATLNKKKQDPIQFDNCWILTTPGTDMAKQYRMQKKSNEWMNTILTYFNWLPLYIHWKSLKI